MEEARRFALSLLGKGEEVPKEAVLCAPCGGPGGPEEGGVVARAGVRTGVLLQYLEGLTGLPGGPGFYLADLMTGVVRFFFRPHGGSLEPIARARRAAEDLGGYLLLESCPEPFRSLLGTWGKEEDRLSSPLLARLKLAFDPEVRLAPGRIPYRLARGSAEAEGFSG